MRSLSVDQLRSLVEVAALGSFSAAARRLNLTQPAVSLQVRELESRFGVQLLERFGKQAHLTAPGRDLVEHARRILKECDAAEMTMRHFREGWIGRVHIATTLTALMYDLPPVLKQLRLEHPEVELSLSNMATRDTVEQVLQNTVDFGLVTLPVKSALLKITPLRPEMLVAILPDSSSGVPDWITPEYVAAQSLVLEHDRGAVNALVMHWLAKELPLRREPMRVGIIEAAKQSVAAGLGISIVPDVAVRDPPPGILVRPLKPAVPCTLGLIEHRKKPNEPALELVRNAILKLRRLPAKAPRRTRYRRMG